MNESYKLKKQMFKYTKHFIIAVWHDRAFIVLDQLGL